MQRLTVAGLIIAAVVFFLLSGCSKPTTTQLPQDTQSKEKITIKLAHVEPETRSLHQACVEFKNYVENETEGQVVVEIYPNGQLGGDRQAIEGVSLGTIQMTAAASAVMSGYDPKFGVLDLPYVFKTREASYKACDGELGEKLNAALPSLGLRGLGYNDNGLRHITNNVRPIYEPKDLKGIKIRVMENPVYVDMFRAVGANATPMNFGEVYTALQQKTVDGQENPASLIYASKFFEVQKYLSLTGHTYSFNILLINDAFFQKLPSDIQKVITEGAQKYLRDRQRELEASQETDFIAKLKQAGMKVNEVSPEGIQKFVDAMKPVHEKYEKQLGAEIMSLALKVNG